MTHIRYTTPPGCRTDCQAGKCDTLSGSWGFLPAELSRGLRRGLRPSSTAGLKTVHPCRGAMPPDDTIRDDPACRGACDLRCPTRPTRLTRPLRQRTSSASSIRQRTSSASSDKTTRPVRLDPRPLPLSITFIIWLVLNPYSSRVACFALLPALFPYIPLSIALRPSRCYSFRQRFVLNVVRDNILNCQKY